MNKVILLGHLTNDPEQKTFNSKDGTEQTMSKFSIGVNDSRSWNQSFFFNCIAWGQIAEYINNNLHKGDFVSIDGRITNRNYINAEGKKIYITEVVADAIKNYGSKKNNVKEEESKVLIDDIVTDKINVDLSKAFSTKENEEQSSENNSIDWEEELK